MQIQSSCGNAADACFCMCSLAGKLQLSSAASFDKVFVALGNISFQLQSSSSWTKWDLKVLSIHTKIACTIPGVQLFEAVICKCRRGGGGDKGFLFEVRVD